MVAVSKHGPKEARFAVVRNYQPARIEHELLVQVFEIVGRGAADQITVADDDKVPIQTLSDCLPQPHLATAGCEIEALHDRHMERAA